jgi:hypothetical protein
MALTPLTPALIAPATPPRCSPSPYKRRAPCPEFTAPLPTHTSLSSHLSHSLTERRRLIVISWHTPWKCVRVLVGTTSIRLSEDNRDSWVTCTTSTECKIVITVMLTVMSGMDPHMIRRNLRWVWIGFGWVGLSKWIYLGCGSITV